MRFCPFCSVENNDDQGTCVACGRRMPPLPPRRARNAPPTGVQLPARVPSIPPRKSGTTVPPPVPPSVPPPGAFHADDFNTMPAAPAFTEGLSRGESDPKEAERRSLLSAISPGPAAQRREAPPPEPRDGEHARRARDVRPSQQPPAGVTPRHDPQTEVAVRANGPQPANNIRRVPTQPPPLPGSGPHVGPRVHPPSQPPPSVIPRATGSQPTEPNRAPSPSPVRKPPTLPPPGPHAPMRPLTPPPVGADTSSPLHAPSPYPTLPSTPSETPDPIEIAARTVRHGTGATPPPTRIQQGTTDRPFTPPKVLPVPEIPEPGLVNAAKYSVRFTRARWQRRGAIKTLGAEIKQDTEALDQVLGALGREARVAKVEGRVFSAENAAIDAAEARMVALGKEHGDVDARKAEENSKFVDVETERNTKLGEAEKTADEAQKELQQLEGQRRALRDKRKELERRQKTYLKNAEDNDRQAGTATIGEVRADLRRSAEGHRKEAAALEPERQDVDRKLAALERPIGEAVARLDAARAELDAAKRSLTDAREGHNHRLAELDAEQKRKSREIGLAEAEVQRRLVTLGTLVNLNRIDNAAFAELYERIDRIRGAITARTTEIEKLTAEREAYDRGTLVRGFSTIGGAIVLFIAFIVILRAIL